MRYVFLISHLLLFFVYSHLPAQSSLVCSQDELPITRAMKLRSDSLEEAYQDAMRRRATQAPEQLPPPYVLPVVFHVIHQGGNEQLDVATIESSLEMMNESFANINYYDQGTGVDTRIQFCLAQRTPDNQATNGITYHNSPLTDVTSNNDLAMKDLARWDPRQYINIYVVKSICRSSCAVAGYAYLPGAHGLPMDGIVVEARWLGENESNNALMPHEMGHYLGLNHTFQGGCTNNDCMADGDRVCDTPPDQSTAAVPCSGTANSCNTDTDSGFATDQNDLFNNYMDYGYWGCYNAFTQGQVDRMYFFIEGTRRSLLESLGCSSPCPAPVVTDFTHAFGPGNNLEAGQVVNFTNQSVNADNYEWYINGVLVSTATDFSYTFHNEGFYNIRLVAYSNDDLCREMSYDESFRVTCTLSPDFTATPNIITIGETVNFSANDISANDFNWTVNGTTVANTSSYDHLFDQAGIFEICLEVSRDSCSRENCSFYYINPPTTGSDSCFGETFFSIYALNAGDNVEAGPITLRQDGTIWHSTVIDNKILLQVLDVGGNVLSSREIVTFGISNTNRISAIRELFNGSVLIVGYSGDGGVLGSFRSFFLLYDPNTDALVYYKTIEYNCRIINAIPVMDAATDRHLLLLDVSPIENANGSNEAWLLDLDPLSGTVGNVWNYQTNQDGPHTFTHGYFSGGSFYGIGRIGVTPLVTSFRAGIARFDAPNTLSDLTTFHRPNTSSARLYGQQLLVGGPGSGGHYTLHHGNPTGSDTDNNYWSYLSSWSQDELFWTRELRVQNSSKTVIYEVKEQNGILYAYGAFWQDQITPTHFIAALDGNGDVIWANTYEIDGLETGIAQTSAGGFMITTNSHLITSVSLSNNSGVSQATGLLKITLEGSVEESCLEQTPILLNSQEVDPFQDFFQLADTDRIPNDFHVDALLETNAYPRYTACQDSCATNDECSVTGDVFAQVLSSQDLQGLVQGQVMTLDGQGGLVVAGSSTDQIFLHRLNQTGEANNTFTINIPTTGGNADIITIENTNNGKILFGGIMPPRPGMNRTGFFACFDLASNTIDWWRELDDDAEIKGMHQIGSSGEFVLTGSRLSQGISNNSSILIQRRNISDGDLSGNLYVEYDFASDSDQILNSYLSGNILHLACRYSGDAGLSQMRAAYTSINITSGNTVFSQISGPSFNEVARTYSTGLVANENGMFVLYRGDLNGTGTTAVSRVYLAHFTRDGQWVWGRSYDINNYNGEYGLSLNALGDDLIISGNGYGPRDIFAMRVRQANGNLVWGRGIHNQNGNDLYFNLRGENNTQVLGQNILMIATQQTGPNTSQPTLIVMDTQGNGPTTNCLEISALDISIGEIPIWNEMGLEPWDTPLGDVTDTPILSQVNFTPLTPCLDSCQSTATEICDNGIDDDGNGFTDCEDPSLAQTCCCLDGPWVSLPDDTIICAVWPFTINSNTSSSQLDYSWSVGLQDDSITVFEYGTYSVTVTDTCGRTASDTIVIFPRNLPAPPDLGPDLIVCDNGVLNLDAGPGFASYLWSDLTTEQTATLYEPGSFWLQVTDSCGNVYSDTVNLIISPATSLDLIDEIVLCPDDSTSLSVSGFTTYEWYPRNVLNCNDCPDVTIYPPSIGDSMVFTLVVSNGNGCYSSDSIVVRTQVNVGTNEVAMICAGQTYVFNEDTLNTAGIYTSLAECGRTDTLELIVNQPTAVVQLFDTICVGGSVSYFGQTFGAAGLYADTLIALNGCDSITTLSLSVLSPPMSTNNLSICQGDSVLIFGDYQSVAGTYQQEFAIADHPCDSIAIVNLSILDAPSPTVNITTECGQNTASVAIGNLAASDLLVWDDTDINGPLVELTEGQYAFTVSNQDNCSTTTLVDVDIPEAVVLDLLSTPPTCFEGDDGIIRIEPSQTNSIVIINGDTLGVIDSITDLTAGNYQLTIIDSLNCEQYFDVELLDPNPFFVLLPEDTVLRIGDSLSINSNLFNLDPLLASYHWFPNDYLNCDTCSSVISQPQQSIEYLLTVTDTLGCQASDLVRILLDRRERVYVPTGFTPNSDGVNDVFYPFFGPEVEAVEIMQIHERWGGMVYERENFPPNDPAYGWDGRYNGQIMKPNVFVYHIRFRLIDGRRISVAGDLTLLR